MHLDGRFSLVPPHAMLEPLKNKIACELAIDARQQIEIEACGDAGRVVIGWNKNGKRLTKIHPNQRTPLGADVTADSTQKRRDLNCVQVANGGPWKKGKA